LEKFGWENLDHPPLQSWPGTFRLPSFPKNESVLGSKRIATNEEVKQTVSGWLNGLAADFYDEGIVKLVQRLNKCLNRNGGYIEK
jgi:hypothetical protein